MAGDNGWGLGETLEWAVALLRWDMNGQPQYPVRGF